jgi:hypothetical protein
VDGSETVIEELYKLVVVVLRQFRPNFDYNNAFRNTKPICHTISTKEQS